MNIKKLFLFVALLAVACNTTPIEKPLVVKEDPAKAAANAKIVLENTPVQLAEGLTIRLWASDSLAPDPIALSIDDLGRVYLTSTNRQKNSEFDIRGYVDACRDHGYPGPWGVEVLSEELRNNPIEVIFKRAYESTAAFVGGGVKGGV